MVFEPRSVAAKGLEKTALVREKIYQYLLDEEIALLPLLKQLPSFPGKRVRMLYPGCGTDILFPLLYAEHLFPSLGELELLFIDRHDVTDTIKAVLDDVGVSFEEKGGWLRFYWRELLVSLQFLQGDIFSLLPSLPAFDAYFERAFRIMKDGKQGYEETVVEKLKDGGLLISDSGFESAALRKFSVPQELSSYGAMVLGVKKG